MFSFKNEAQKKKLWDNKQKITIQEVPSSCCCLLAFHRFYILVFINIPRSFLSIPCSPPRQSSCSPSSHTFPLLHLFFPSFEYLESHNYYYIDVHCVIPNVLTRVVYYHHIIIWFFRPLFVSHFVGPFADSQCLCRTQSVPWDPITSAYVDRIIMLGH